MVMPFFLGPHRPECGFPPSAFECLGAAKPLLHNSRPAVGNLRATHRALILLLLAPNHNRLCWVVILFFGADLQLLHIFRSCRLCGRKVPFAAASFYFCSKKDDNSWSLVPPLPTSATYIGLRSGPPGPGPGKWPHAAPVGRRAVFSFFAGEGSYPYTSYILTMRWSFS